MTTEEKELLLKDLCARLPYRLIAHAPEINKNGIITGINIPYNIVNLTVDIRSGKYELVPLFDIKPYLRSELSMTEEEIKTYRTLQDMGCSYHCEFDDIVENPSYFDEGTSYFDNDASLDYLNSIHIDHRGLIPRGLALEAPEDMYKEE